MPIKEKTPKNQHFQVISPYFPEKGALTFTGSGATPVNAFGIKFLQSAIRRPYAWPVYLFVVLGLCSMKLTATQYGRPPTAFRRTIGTWTVER